MLPFEYLAPCTLAEVCALLAAHGPRTMVLAGGTDLLVEIKEHLRQVDRVVDIKGIDELRDLCAELGKPLSIGAAVTAREVETEDFIRAKYASLWQAARELGSIQVRNRATVVGNVCRASPSADTLPPLIADGAIATLAGCGSSRTVPLEHFFVGPGRTVLEAGEIVTGLQVPVPGPHTGKVYLKHGRRKAMELATVGVAVTLVREGERVRDVRIVLGAVAPTPIRALETEVRLRNTIWDDRALADAAGIAQSEAMPIGNVRASADYRRRMVGVLVRRALVQAYEAAQ